VYYDPGNSLVGWADDVLECISIQTPQGTALIDNVIAYLAWHLAT